MPKKRKTAKKKSSYRIKKKLRRKKISKKVQEKIWIQKLQTRKANYKPRKSKTRLNP